MTLQVPTLTAIEAEIKQEIEANAQRAQTLQVKDAETFNQATNLYAYARAWKKRIDSTLKMMQEPYKQKISEFKEQAKTLTDPLDAIIERTNAETTAYSALLEKNKEADDFFSLDGPVEAKSLGEGATLIKKIEKRFRIVNEHEVPRQFLKPNEDKIATHVKLGVDNIPGVEIYEETVTSLRRKG